MKAFVVPDIHGNFHALRSLLEVEGLIEDNARTALGEDTYIVHVGDLANCVYNEDEDGGAGYDSCGDDLRCLSKVGHWIDQLIVGNHEHPYFGGPAFNGFAFRWDVAFRLYDLAQQDLLIPCVNIDGVFVSHAGLSEKTGLIGKWLDSATAAATISKIWAVDPIDRLFSAIGYKRGGLFDEGGLLWSDCSDRRYGEFPQVFGHTPGNKVRSNLHPTDQTLQRGVTPWYCIDLGGGKLEMPWGRRLAGAWIEEGKVRIVEHDVPPEPSE